MAGAEDQLVIPLQLQLHSLRPPLIVLFVFHPLLKQDDGNPQSTNTFAGVGQDSQHLHQIHDSGFACGVHGQQDSAWLRFSYSILYEWTLPAEIFAQEHRTK